MYCVFFNRCYFSFFLFQGQLGGKVGMTNFYVLILDLLIFLIYCRVAYYCFFGAPSGSVYTSSVFFSAFRISRCLQLYQQASIFLELQKVNSPKKKKKKPTTTDFEITLKGFKIIRKDAVRKLETGIAIYASNSLKYSCKM